MQHTYASKSGIIHRLESTLTLIQAQAVLQDALDIGLLLEDFDLKAYRASLQAVCPSWAKFFTLKAAQTILDQQSSGRSNVGTIAAKRRHPFVNAVNTADIDAGKVDAGAPRQPA